jgi:hypothetical protein
MCFVSSKLISSTVCFPAEVSLPKTHVDLRFKRFYGLYYKLRFALVPRSPHSAQSFHFNITAPSFSSLEFRPVIRSMACSVWPIWIKDNDWWSDGVAYLVFVYSTYLCSVSLSADYTTEFRCEDDNFLAHASVNFRLSATWYHFKQPDNLPKLRDTDDVSPRIHPGFSDWWGSCWIIRSFSTGTGRHWSCRARGWYLS